MTDKKCGVVAFVGRANVGKSTLMNHLIGQKISITSRRPQTTRHRIHGIVTEDDYQMVIADTPGLHEEETLAMNKMMNQTAFKAMAGVDVLCFVVDALKWTAGDEYVLSLLEGQKTPVFLVINKIDSLDDKHALLPHIAKLQEKYNFVEIVPVSALGGHNLDALERSIVNYLPKGEFLYDEDDITDRNMRFIAAEMIREKIFRQLGDELPYQMTVEVEQWEDKPRVTHIAAAILVERKGQKKILIGTGGDRIKKIGTDARKEIENLIGRQVMLNLWVRVRSGWSDDERALRSLGFADDHQ